MCTACIESQKMFAMATSLRKGKEHSIYIAPLSMHAYSNRSDIDHSFTCKQHHACLSFVRVHYMAPPQLRQQTSNSSLLLIYRPQKDERLSWPGWLTYNGWFTHISDHPSPTGRAQKVRRSKTDVLPLCHLGASYRQYLRFVSRPLKPPP